MSASKALVLATLFLATMFAETEWKEFSSSEGNFRVVFPETPQQQKGTERNLHRFSAGAGDESYGLTYADYPPGTDWESVVDGERDSIVNGFALGLWWTRNVLQSKVIQGNGPGLLDRIRAENLPSTSSCTACMYCTPLLRRARLGRRIFLHF